MKKYIFICAFILLLSGCSDRDPCFVPGCTNKAGYPPMLYCKEHTCTKDGCNGKKGKYDDLCVDCQNQKLKEIISSSETIENARKEAITYCELLKSKHGYIKNIEIETNHKIIGTSMVVFDCKVIQTDAIRPASIYVNVFSDGSFQVDELIYN